MGSSSSRVRVGLAIATASMAMAIGWGVQFHFLAPRFAPDLGTLGFFVWMAPGMFGLGYATGGWRAGAKVAALFWAGLVAAYGVGAAWRALLALT